MVKKIFWSIAETLLPPIKWCLRLSILTVGIAFLFGELATPLRGESTVLALIGVYTHLSHALHVYVGVTFGVSIMAYGTHARGASST